MNGFLRTAAVLLVLLGAGLTIAPSPAAAGSDPCDGLVCPPGTLPGPCGVLQVNDCKCLTQVGSCGIALPDGPCATPGDPCQCLSFQEETNRDTYCGVPANPCGSAGNLCGCVDVPTTTTFGRAPTHGSSCGFALPKSPTDPCASLPASSCGCVNDVAPGVLFAAVLACGVPTNPCGLVGSGTPANGCGCVHMSGMQSQAYASGTHVAVLPTSVCGVSTDPCGVSALACECIAQVERQLPPGHFDGSGSTPFPFVNQRIVTPPALCVEAGDGGCSGGTSGPRSLPVPNYPPGTPLPTKLLNGGSTWTFQVTRFVVDGQSTPVYCAPAPLPYGPDHGLQSTYGLTVHAQQEPWGDHECHFYDGAWNELDGYYYAWGGYRGRMKEQFWKGVLDDPYGYASIGHSSQAAYHNYVFDTETYPYTLFNSGPSEGINEDMCNVSLHADEGIAQANLLARWLAGGYVSSAASVATICYQVPSNLGHSVEACGDDMGLSTLSVGFTVSGTFTGLGTVNGQFLSA